MRAGGIASARVFGLGMAISGFGHGSESDFWPFWAYQGAVNVDIVNGVRPGRAGGNG